MPVTKEQAMTASRFHFHNGERCYLWRRDGATQVWKSRPEDFSIPLKHGLYRYCRLDFHADSRHKPDGRESAMLGRWNTEADCPYCAEES